MERFKFSLLAAAGILVLAFVLTAVGPKRVMAALGYTPVRDVDNPGRQPFQATARTVDSEATFSIPAGKRLVLTTVSAVTASTTAVHIDINASVVGAPPTDVFVPFTASLGSLRYASLAGYNIIQAGPGGSLSVLLIGNFASGFTVGVSGYLVDAP